MKIYELVKKLNTKVQIKASDVMSAKKYYISLYRANMVLLYDKGYISDPTVFNTKEIFSNVLDLNIKYLTGVAGKIELSEDYIGYALAKYRSDEEKAEFLELLLKAVKYRNISMNIDKFYEDCDFSSSSKKKISLNIAQAASRIFTKNGYNLDEGIFRCIYGFEYGVDFISLDEVIYETALRELDLYDIYSEEGLFVSGITREDEIKYSHLVLNGLVKLDGRYSEKLVSWLKNNKWSNDNKFSSQNEGLYNWVSKIKSNNMIEEQAKLLNSIIDEGKEIVGALTNGYFVLTKPEYMEFPVGVFAVVSDTDDDILPSSNALEGYTGELYSLQYLNRESINYVGCPIELFVKGVKKGLFVDKEQTDMKDSISWFSHIDANLSFNENFEHDVRLNSGALTSKMQEILMNSERGILISQIKVEDYLNMTDELKVKVDDSLN